MDATAIVRVQQPRGKLTTEAWLELLPSKRTLIGPAILQAAEANF